MDALPLLIVELLIECGETGAEGNFVLESLHVLALVATAKLHDELVARWIEHRVDFQDVRAAGIRVQHETRIGQIPLSR